MSHNLEGRNIAVFGVANKRSIAWSIAQGLHAKRTFLTHICHDLGHERAESLLPPNIRLAYDGLELHVS